MQSTISRSEDQDGTLTLKNDDRGAVVYPVVGAQPPMWRIRLEKYPANIEAGSGWFGGRVWDRDYDNRAAAEHLAIGWVEHAVDLGLRQIMIDQFGGVGPDTELPEPPAGTVWFQFADVRLPAFVVGYCGHRVSLMEWQAGCRSCERCPDVDRPQSCPVCLADLAREGYPFHHQDADTGAECEYTWEPLA